MPGEQYKYIAFISYSHCGDSKLASRLRSIFPQTTLFARDDMKWAVWLQRKLETYRLPATLSRQYNLDPKNSLKPVFRDEDELGGGGVGY